jgi:hypothetical protein
VNYSTSHRELQAKRVLTHFFKERAMNTSLVAIPPSRIAIPISDHAVPEFNRTRIHRL